jgi:hypothetical protein
LDVFRRCDDATKAPPCMPVPIYSAEKSMEHFERNRAPMLAALMQNQGGDTEWLYAGLRNGRRRRGVKHRLIASIKAPSPRIKE